MADMHDSAVHTFRQWQRGVEYYKRWLGEFNPNMSWEEAWERLDYKGKLTPQAEQLFSRGWMAAAQTC